MECRQIQVWALTCAQLHLTSNRLNLNVRSQSNGWSKVWFDEPVPSYKVHRYGCSDVFPPIQEKNWHLAWERQSCAQSSIVWYWRLASHDRIPQPNWFAGILTSFTNPSGHAMSKRKGSNNIIYSLFQLRESVGSEAIMILMYRVVKLYLPKTQLVCVVLAPEAYF